MSIEPDRYPSLYYPPLAHMAILEVYENYRFPKAMIASSVRSAMVIAAQLQHDVRMPDGKVMGLSHNSFSILLSGEGKTTAEILLSPPFEIFEKEQAEKYDVQSCQYKAKLKIWKSIGEGFMAAIRAATLRGDSTVELEAKLIEHESKLPARPRKIKLIYTKPTLAALYEGASQDCSAIALVSDEGAMILKAKVINECGTLNKFWDTRSFAVERGNDGTLHIEDPRLVINIMVQPDVFDRFMLKHGAESRAVGFWARSWVIRPDSTQGARTAKEVMSWEYLPKFNERILEILRASVDETGKRMPERVVHDFSPEAAALLHNIRQEIELELSDGGCLADIRDFAAKHVDILARVACTWHVFNGAVGDISVDVVKLAALLSEYHLGENKRLFGGVPQLECDAQHVLKHAIKLAQKQNNNCIRRYHLERESHLRADRLDEALGYLEHQGRVRLQKVSNRMMVWILPQQSQPLTPQQQHCPLDLVLNVSAPMRPVDSSQWIGSAQRYLPRDA